MPGASVDKDVNAPTASDTEPKLKKKKSVMGRLKSTLSTKLGRRKSSSGDLVTSPTDKDLADRHGAPETSGKSSGTSSSSTRERRQQQNEEYDEYPDDYEDDDVKRSTSAFDSARDPADRTDSMTTNAASPFDLMYLLPDKTPVMQMEQLADADEADDGAAYGVPQVQQIRIPSEKAIASSPIRLIQTQPPNFSEMEEEDTDQQGQINEEVFASDYSEEKQSPQCSPDIDDEEDQLEVFQTDNQEMHAVVSETAEPNPFFANGLVVIGQSPVKLSRASPDKRLRSRSQVLESFPPPEVPDTSPKIPSPVRNPRVSPMPSPVNQVHSSPMPSPVKHGRSSPMPSPTKGISTTPVPAEHMEQILEEEKPSSSSKKPQRPPPAGTSRRKSINMDAPILASSFAANPADDDTTAHEAEATGTQQDNGSLDQLDDMRAKALEETSAFAFDAGAAITQAFGDRVARLLGADPWGDRQDGFDAIQFAIRKTDLGAAVNKRELLCAALAAVQCGVEDRVAPVMYCALECLRAVLKEYASVLDRSFSKFPPLNEHLSSLLQALVGKLSDANKRTQREAAQAIARLSKLRKLRALPHVLLHLSGKDVSPRLQMEMIRRLVQDIGLGTPADGGKPSQYPQLTLEVVMQYVLPSLKVADDKTRKAVVELLADLYVATSPAAVNVQLSGLKPDLLRVITRRVDELVAQRLLEKQQQQQASATNQNDERNLAEEEDAKRAAELMVPIMAEDSRAAATLLDEQLNAASNIVGPVIWRKLLSKTWSDRKEALVDLGRAITEAKSDLRDAKPAFGSIIQSNYCAYCVVAHKFLGDSIQPVVNEALELLTTLVKVFGSTVEWREDVVRDLTLLTLNRLFQTMQKPQNRTTRAACRCVLKLARLPNSRHPLRYTLSCVFAKDADPTVQMHLLRLLVPELGFQPEGLSASMVLSAAAAALNNPSDKVRKVAADVALATQRLVGRVIVLEKLKDVKPATLKELEKSFVDIDRDNSERPQTVHAVGPAVGSLPPVQFNNDRSRRQLNSAPVGVGKLQCFPQGQEEEDALGFEINTELDTGVVSMPTRAKGSVLSNDEESLMDSILDGGDA